jgi:hypothetical protein
MPAEHTRARIVPRYLWDAHAASTPACRVPVSQYECNFAPPLGAIRAPIRPFLLTGRPSGSLFVSPDRAKMNVFWSRRVVQEL